MTPTAALGYAMITFAGGALAWLAIESWQDRPRKPRTPDLGDVASTRLPEGTPTVPIRRCSDVTPVGIPDPLGHPDGHHRCMRDIPEGRETHLGQHICTCGISFVVGSEVVTVTTDECLARQAEILERFPQLKNWTPTCKLCTSMHCHVNLSGLTTDERVALRALQGLTFMLGESAFGSAIQGAMDLDTAIGRDHAAGDHHRCDREQCPDAPNAQR